MTLDAPSSCALPSHAWIGIGDMHCTSGQIENLSLNLAALLQPVRTLTLTGLDSLAYSYMIALFCQFVLDGECSCTSLPAGGWLDPVDLCKGQEQISLVAAGTHSG